MWQAWIKASKYSKLPSEVLDPRGVWDDVTRYLVDNAVTYFGLTIENALHETRQTGSGSSARTVARYKLSELLNDTFQFQPDNDLDVFKPLENYEEV